MQSKALSIVYSFPHFPSFLLKQSRVKAGCSSVSSKARSYCAELLDRWNNPISLKLGPFLNCELTISNEFAITTVINSLQHSINTCFKTQLFMLTTQNISVATTWAFIMGVNINYLQAVNSKEPRTNQKKYVKKRIRCITFY